jgi:glycosyltransferase involved in cell wall biosynthesis
MNKIAVVIPIFNEENQIEKLVNNILEHIRKNLQSNHDFVLSIDKSSDRTMEKLLQLDARGSEFNCLKYIENQKERGYGSNVRNGIDYAKKTGYDWVVIMDSDLSNPLEDLKIIEDIIIELKEVDYIKGNRFYKIYGSLIQVPLNRRIITNVGNRVARHILKSKYSDPTNGFRAIKMNKIEFLGTKELSFPVITEELFLAIKNNLKIYEFQTDLRYDNILRRESSFNLGLKLIKGYLKYLIKARRYI